MSSIACPKAEAAVKKLARLPANQTCPNCGTHKKFGFSTVCIKYHTFVCNMCKASHAAVSHRCKSLTMSSWTTAEVLKLKSTGNNKARETWLARAPPPGTGGRPKEGDPIETFKRFVVDVYERKRYFSEAGDGGDIHATGNNAVPSRVPPSPVPISKPRRVAAKPKAPVPAAPAPPVATMDLLSLDSPPPESSSSVQAPVFDAFGADNTVSSASTSEPPKISDPFSGSNNVQMTPSAAPAPVAKATGGNTFDPFQNQGNSSTMLSNGSSNGLVPPPSQTTTSVMNNSSVPNGKDPFANMGGPSNVTAPGASSSQYAIGGSNVGMGNMASMSSMNQQQQLMMQQNYNMMMMQQMTMSNQGIMNPSLPQSGGGMMNPQQMKYNQTGGAGMFAGSAVPQQPGGLMGGVGMQQRNTTGMLQQQQQQPMFVNNGMNQNGMLGHGAGIGMNSTTFGSNNNQRIAPKKSAAPFQQKKEDPFGTIWK